MKLETCSVSLPPTLGAMLATFGQLTEFRVAFGGSRGTVTLIYGDKRRKRTRGKKPSAPGAAKGEPKPSAKLPAAVPSFVPPTAQPGASREVQGVQSWWLNHRWRARLVTGAHLLLQPGRDPDRCFQHTRLPRGRRHLDLLFFLQLRSSLQLPWRFPLSRWPRKGRHHRRCLPRLQRAPSAHHRPDAGRQLEAGSGGGLETTSRLPWTISQTCHANRLRMYGRCSQTRWAKLTSGWRAEALTSW